MASKIKTATGESVDFDFFSTPRNEDIHETGSLNSEDRIYYKPPPFEKQPKHGEDLRASDSFSARKRTESASESSDSDLSSDIETESDHSKGSRRSDSKNNSKLNGKRDTPTESSSAYSDSSSDDESKIIERERMKNQKASRDRKYNRPSDRDVGQNRPSSSKEAWGSGIEKIEIINKPKSIESEDEKFRRPKSAKYNVQRGRYRRHSDGRSASDSEITDVSPLPSPREDDRDGDKKVQYDLVENGDGEIKLESKKLDLSILMEAVSEIESNNRQQRLRNNTRRVMFEPPSAKSREKSNFSFDQSRVKMIEKENQRLLSEIMRHIGPNKKQKRKIVHESPVIQRATPSAINRQRQQRKIEEENMAFLRRLQGTKPTRGMSRNEQITNYETTVLHGVPIAAIHNAQSTLNKSLYSSPTPTLGGTHGSIALSTGRRSRPSSAKSNASSIRSRPGSAKSSASIRSRPSSAKSNRSVDTRPAWNDRFAYT